MSGRNEIPDNDGKKLQKLSKLSKEFFHTIETKLGDKINDRKYSNLPQKAMDTYSRLASSIYCNSTDDNIKNSRELLKLIKKAGYQYPDIMLGHAVQTIQKKLGIRFSAGIDGVRQQGAD